MRIRLDLDAVSQQSAPQRYLMALPPALTLISDLVHHLHRRLSLPACSVTLAVDNFALLPALRIQDILRDGDMVQVWPSFVASPTKRRKITKAGDRGMLALADASPGYINQMNSLSPQIGRKTTAAPLALPGPEERLEGKGNAVQLEAKQSSGLLQRQRHPKPTTYGRAVAAPLALPCLQQPLLTSPKASPASEECLKRMEHLADEDDCAPPEKLDSSTRSCETSHQTPPLVSCADYSMLGLPNPDDQQIWKAIDRNPSPGEMIRFRRASLRQVGVKHHPLSPFQVALCFAVLESEDGPVCVLRQGEGEEQVPIHELLQISIQRLKAPPQKKSTKDKAVVEVIKTQEEVVTQTNLAPQSHAPVESSDSDDEQSVSEPVKAESYKENVTARNVPQVVVDKPTKYTRRKEETKEPTIYNFDLTDEDRLKEILSKCEVPAGVNPNDFACEKLQKLKRALLRQVDYYFGDDNYPKDNFLRAQAYYDGWTDLTLIAKFNRMRELTRDYSLIVECSQTSDIVDVSDCGFYVRRKIALS